MDKAKYVRTEDMNYQWFISYSFLNKFCNNEYITVNFPLSKTLKNPSDTIETSRKDIQALQIQ